VALFGDRAAAAVKVSALGRPLSSDKQFLARTIKRYGIVLL
jgi:hypothetical protein